MSWREIDGKPSVIIREWYGRAPDKARVPIQLTIPQVGSIDSLSRVRNILAGLAPQRIDWEGITLAEVRIAIAGDSLAVHARINDAASGPDKSKWARVSNLDIFISNIDSKKSRFLCMRNIPAAKSGKQFVFREGELSLPPIKFPFEVLPLQSGGGFELTALVPLSFFQLDPQATEFLFESAVWAAPTANSSEHVFITMFGGPAPWEGPEFFAHVTVDGGD